jgi:uncharacterized membrane protein
MDEKKIEDLSNLVFGLALTLGAFSLIKPATDDLVSLSNTVVQFGLSFAVIIWIWWLFNRMVNEQDLARKGMVPLNILMLFLVVIEPFLLSVSQSYSSGKVAYSLDLGITLLIMALFTHASASDTRMAPTEPTRRRFRSNRDLSLLCAAIFFVSLVPQLLLGQIGEYIQSMMWLSALFIGMVGRRVLLK